MKINLERNITAPFRSLGDNSLVSIYLIAFGITIGAFIIQMAFSFIQQVAAGFISAFSGHDTAMIIGVVFVAILFLISLIISIGVQCLPLGYVIETIKLEVHDRTTIMPEWNGNIFRFLWNGVKLMLIFFIYTFILMIIIAVPVIILSLLAGVSLKSHSDISSFAGGAIGIIAMIYVFAVMLIYMFLTPMITVRFAAEGRFLAAFNIFAILEKIFTNFVDYIIAILISIVYMVAMLIIFFFLCITCVGWLAIPLVQSFIFPIILLNLFAQVYKD